MPGVTILENDDDSPADKNLLVVEIYHLFV